MAKEAIAKSGLTQKCAECKHRNDIIKLSQIAESQNNRNLYCESCGHRIGQIN